MYIENKAQNTDPDNGNRSMVAFVGETKKALEEMAAAFGYDTLSLAAKNAVAVGYSEFKKSPIEFIQKLNNSKLN
jgi:hypothetical protein